MLLRRVQIASGVIQDTQIAVGHRDHRLVRDPVAEGQNLFIGGLGPGQLALAVKQMT